MNLKVNYFGKILVIVNQEKKKPEDYGHDTNEWGHKDDFEKIEWEEHYKRRNSQLEKMMMFD